jgi:HEPN domain-containing protein
MKTLDDYIKGWLLKANQDYLAFQILVESEKNMLDMAAFHAQQAVEKWLKALILFHLDADPPRIHDIRSLINILSPYYPAFHSEEWRDRAEVFSHFAVEIRYLEPSQPITVIQPDAKILEEALLSFRAFAKEKLGTHWVE